MVATKYVILRPSKGETAEAATGILMDIIRRFGAPQEVTTDRGRAFMSRLFMQACQSAFIRFKPIAVARPQADGAVERVNRTLTDLASIICKGKGRRWSNFIPEIEYAINTRVSSVTGHTPYELVYGRLPPNPVYVDLFEGEEEGGEDEPVQILRARISALEQLAHQNQRRAAAKQISFHDMHALTHRFKVGDVVWAYRPSSIERGVTSKLAFKWSGPYIVIEAHGPVTFSLADKDGKRLPGTFHAMQLYDPDAATCPKGGQV